MPGISFLFKKKFHPSRIDNQKKMFIAEEKTSHRLEQEKELALQIMKEKELQSLEGLGQAPERDPRASSLKFMYAAPSNVKDKRANLLAVPAPPALDANGDDDQVRAFKAKLYKKEGDGSFGTSSSSAPPPPLPAPSDDNEAKELEEEEQAEDKRDFQRLSELEKLSGRRRREVVTAEAMAQRHPSLRNAPTEGRYAQNLALHVKPFNEVIRNVRCLRCGEWGHASGDRECKLRDRNPLDEERQRREDPMTNPRHQTSSCAFIGEDGESDPEAEFLATLTRREKKLLLRKLQELEGVPSKHDNHKKKSKKRKAKHKDHKEKKKRDRKSRSYSSDDDSNSSSSSDSSSSDESDKHIS